MELGRLLYAEPPVGHTTRAWINIETWAVIVWLHRGHLVQSDRTREHWENGAERWVSIQDLLEQKRGWYELKYADEWGEAAKASLKFSKSYKEMTPIQRGEYWRNQEYPTWNLVLRQDVDKLPEPFRSEALKGKPEGWPHFMP